MLQLPGADEVHRRIAAMMTSRSIGVSRYLAAEAGVAAVTAVSAVSAGDVMPVVVRTAPSDPPLALKIRAPSLPGRKSTGSSPESESAEPAGPEPGPTVRTEQLYEDGPTST